MSLATQFPSSSSVCGPAVAHAELRHCKDVKHTRPIRPHHPAPQRRCRHRLCRKPMWALSVRSRQRFRRTCDPRGPRASVPPHALALPFPTTRSPCLVPSSSAATPIEGRKMRSCESIAQTRGKHCWRGTSWLISLICIFSGCCRSSLKRDVTSVLFCCC